MCKNDELPYSLYVVPGNSPALRGMPDCKKLQILSVNFNTIEQSYRNISVNEQSKQDNSKTNILKLICTMMLRLIKPQTIY